MENVKPPDNSSILHPRLSVRWHIRRANTNDEDAMIVHKCNICSREFERRAHLIQHQNRKTPCGPENRHTCPVCTTSFNHQSSLSRHKKTCTGPRVTASKVIEDVTKQLQEARAELTTVKEELAVFKENAENTSELTKIESCCAIAAEDVFKPAVYFGSPGPLLIPDRDIDGHIIKFGESHDVPERIVKSHIPHFGGFMLLDCIKSIDPVLIEKQLKKLLDIDGRRIKCKTSNKTYKDTEVFVVKTQQEYNEVVLKCKRLAEEHAMEVIGSNRAVLEARSAEKEAEVQALLAKLQVAQQSNEPDD